MGAEQIQRLRDMGQPLFEILFTGFEDGAFPVGVGNYKQGWARIGVGAGWGDSESSLLPAAAGTL